MPNIKSAKKRVLVNEKKTEQNKAIRTNVKTEIKKIEFLIKENKIAEAQAALPEVFKVIDSACSKNIIQLNNASNKKSKLAKKVSDAAKAAGIKEEKKTAPAKKAVEKKAEPETVTPAPVEAKAEEKPVAKKTTVKKTTTAKKTTSKKTEKAE